MNNLPNQFTKQAADEAIAAVNEIFANLTQHRQYLYTDAKLDIIAFIAAAKHAAPNAPTSPPTPRANHTRKTINRL